MERCPLSEELPLPLIRNNRRRLEKSHKRKLWHLLRSNSQRNPQRSYPLKKLMELKMN